MELTEVETTGVMELRVAGAKKGQGTYLKPQLQKSNIVQPKRFLGVKINIIINNLFVNHYPTSNNPSFCYYTAYKAQS